MCVFYLQSNLLYTDLTCHCLRHKAWKIRHRNGRCFRSIFICLIIIYIYVESFGDDLPKMTYTRAIYYCLMIAIVFLNVKGNVTCSV